MSDWPVIRIRLALYGLLVSYIRIRCLELYSVKHHSDSSRMFTENDIIIILQIVSVDMFFSTQFNRLSETGLITLDLI